MTDSETLPVNAVYVIGTANSQTVKIGVSKHPTRRLREIQLMSPVPLAVRWSCPGSYELESALHARFERLHAHGEWFTFPEYLAPVPAVRNVVGAFQYISAHGSATRFWSDAPLCDPGQRRYWLNRRIRERFYRHRFTFAEVASAIGAPASFVEEYGSELLAAGDLVPHGHGTFMTTWDPEERYALLGPRPWPQGRSRG